MDRTAEIWSTRLQREVLALTSLPQEASSGGAEAGSTTPATTSSESTADDLSHTTPKHDNLNIASLPPFVKVHEHELNIASGICKVTFAVQVDVPKPDPQSLSSSASATATKTTYEAQTVLITLDASMMGEAERHHLVCYPFQKPLVVLTAGQEYFSEKSTIQNLDYIDLDCDWTPSLHLSDAILNVALKVRESIRRGDFFAPGGGMPATTAAAAATSVADEISSSVSNFLGSLRQRRPGGAAAAAAANNSSNAAAAQAAPPRTKPPSLVKIGDVIQLDLAPYSTSAGMYSCKAIRRPAFVEQAIAQAMPAVIPEEGQTNVSAGAATPNAAAAAAGATDGPQGTASARMRKVAATGFMGASSFFKSIEKSIKESTKSLVEEHFLLVTETHILEVKSSKLQMDQATVTFVSPIALLAKLKFRREESISLFFKQSMEDPLVYLCPESAAAVGQIQAVLKRHHGVKGKHTTSATQKQIAAALRLVSLIRTKEASLEELSQSVKSKQAILDQVNEIMDLYRQAAEKFENAGDARHEEVITHMQQFLAKPLTVSILDGSFEPPQKDNEDDFDDDDGLTQEVASLGRTPQKAAAATATTTTTTTTATPDSQYEDTMKTVDDMMKEVENLGLSPNNSMNEDDPTTTPSSPSSKAAAPSSPAAASAAAGKTTIDASFSMDDEDVDDDHDPVAELDAMLNEADKELEDIMNSA